ncbi:hypothetical protein [Planctomycetes bacterium K23_9]|uniref:DUF4832 domain-containing protein n=1 Tax=Stieleria marina TaxID=1930275 RepID=A0A517NZC7_9BACT|nr:hypothetical protein K239x_44810 [Planctomycetes bacterium K23_9]
MRTVFALLLAALLSHAAAAVELVYAPSPADNPMKGLVPYADADGRDHFPCSLEFRYFAFSDLMSGPSQFDWSAIENTLEQTSSRGNQLVVRIYLEMPGKEKGVPLFLVDAGLEITKWKTNDGMNLTPDYESPSLRKAMTNFIAAFGEKYDGDPRMGYITCGILGMWGEWHDYPRSELFASREVQNEVLDAYEAAFTKTAVLHRYPAGENHYAYVRNDTRPMGYHDDSFAWATLETGDEADNWFYMSLLRQAGPKALEKWRTFPIGGEIRPELWQAHFTDSPHPKQQDFAKCVQQTHVTWLMDSGLFSRKKPSADRVRRAKAAVSKMGYELHVSKAEIADGMLAFTVENRGVAPFYQDWPIEIAFSAPTIRTRPLLTDWKLSGVMPGQTAQWHVKLDPIDDLQVRLRVIHPLSGGKPFRFANKEMQGDALIVNF